MAFCCRCSRTKQRTETESDRDGHRAVTGLMSVGGSAPSDSDSDNLDAD